MAVEVIEGVEEQRVFTPESVQKSVHKFVEVPRMSLEFRDLLHRVLRSLDSPIQVPSLDETDKMSIPESNEEKVLAQVRKLFDAEFPYQPHPLDSDKIAFLGENPFASESFSEGEIVGAMSSKMGEVVNLPFGQELSGDIFESRSFEFERGKYLVSNSVLPRMAYSDDPNCVIEKFGDDYFVVVTNREIADGELLTIARPDFSEEVSKIENQLDQARPKVESYTSPLPEELIDEISDYFLYTFRNEWPNEAVCFDCDSSEPGGMRFSVKDLYGSEKAVPLQIQNRLSLMPDCPCCQEPMTKFMDTALTRKKLAEKFRKDAYVSLVRSPLDNSIVGMTYANVCTPLEAFNSEEWGHPYAYSEARREEDGRDFDQFMDSINRVLEQNNTGVRFSPDSKILLYNCTVVDPVYRSKGVLPKLMRSLFTSFPQDVIQNCWGLGETEKGKMYHQVLKVGGVLDVDGFLSNDLVLMVGEVKKFLNAMMLSPEDFKRLKKQVSES